MPHLSRLVPLLLLAIIPLGACDSAPTETNPPGLDDLLSDRQLETAPDPAAPPENESWVRWTRDHARPVRSLTASRYEDLEFLRPLLQGKRLVQLGESSHGVREFNQAKVRLIRYLHEELGYDVIAFESGVFECWRANGRATTVPAETTMRECIFGVWHTEEVRQLFEYIAETHRTPRPLLLAGFDTQMSTDAPHNEADLLLRDVVEKMDAAYGQRVAELDAGFLAEYRQIRRAGNPSGAAFTPLRRLIPAYDSLVTWIDAHAAELAQAHGGANERPEVARQTAFSRIRWIEQLSEPSGSVAGALARERGMADNLTRFLTHTYSGRKIIAWAHNYHVQHDRAGILPGDGSDPGDLGDFNTMGHFLRQRHRAEMYTVGLFMYRGQAAFNNRSLYSVTPAVSGSLESLGYRVRRRHFFLDLSAASGRGSEWTGQMVPAKDWGVWDMRQVLRDQFDGILFIDTVTPPQYL